jgi:uncharacterized protein (UPF0332 family)
MRFREGKYSIWLEDPKECDSDFQEFLQKGALIPIHDGEVWKKRHLEKADHNLDFASLVSDLHRTAIKERLPGKTFYDWVTVSYYYAVYHAALALVSLAGFKSKSHMATLCGVIRFYYHKDRMLERKHLETLSLMEKANIEQFVESQSLRERASYGVSVSFEERLSLMARKDAIEFVNKVKEILKE